MKIKGIIVNARHYRAGKRLATWAAVGMNWADPAKSSAMSAGLALLGNAGQCAALGAWASKQVDGCWQSQTTHKIMQILGRPSV